MLWDSHGCSNLQGLLINSLSRWSFSSKSSKQLNFQTIWARDQKFWENIHLPPYSSCHVSRVTYHLSHVTSYVSNVFWVFFCKVVELVGGGSVINGPTPRLVFKQLEKWMRCTQTAFCDLPQQQKNAVPATSQGASLLYCKTTTITVE